MTAVSSPVGTPTAATGLRAFVEHGWIIASRDMTRLSRNPDVLVFTLIQPIMFVILFRYVFGGAIGTSLPAGVSYADFLIPGVLVQDVAFGATGTAVGVSDDLKTGLMDRLKSLPMSRSAVLVGRITDDTARMAVAATVLIAVGYGVGFRFAAGVVPAIGMVLLALGFGIAISWFGVLLGTKVSSSEAAQNAMFLTMFPLTFASSVFVPIETLPSWLEGFARQNPVSRLAEAMRACALGGETAEPVLIAVLWIVGITAVAAPLAVREFRKV